jgi:hypothetical protein
MLAYKVHAVVALQLSISLQHSFVKYRIQNAREPASQRNANYKHQL